MRRSTVFFILSILLDLTAVIGIFAGMSAFLFAVMWLVLGTACLCLGFAQKMREDEADQAGQKTA